jgi:hypothetical protein
MSAMADKRALGIERISEWTGGSSDHRMAQAIGS